MNVAAANCQRIILAAHADCPKPAKREIYRLSVRSMKVSRREVKKLLVQQRHPIPRPRRYLKHRHKAHYKKNLNSKCKLINLLQTFAIC